MSRIDDLFRQLRREQKTALMPFVTGGYPSLETTGEVLPALERAGASIVEIGFPFSDPIADGPVIAASMHEALQRGATPSGLFDCVSSLRESLSLGLVAMVSESIVWRIGTDRFVQRAAEAGFDGLIVPDMDPDDADDLYAAVEDADLALSLLIAPASSDARIEKLVARCRGFVYLLARAGITGESDRAPEIAGPVERLRSMTDLPIAVGFGVSSPAHVRAVTQHADAAIVGSALVRRMGEADDPTGAAESFVRELATGLATPSPSAP